MDATAPRFVMPDVDAFAELMKHQGAEIVRCVPAVQPDVVNLLQLPDVLVRLGEQYTQWTCIGEAAQGHLSFVVPLICGPEARFNGVPVQQGMLPIYGAGMEHISMLRESEFFYVAVPEQLILPQLLALCGRLPQYSGDVYVADAGPGRVLVLRALVHRMFRTVREHAGPVAPSVLRSMQNELIELLTHSICASQPVREQNLALAQRRKVFSMAFEYARETLSEGHQLADLCAVGRVSERTLRSLFTEFTGHSPARFLHRLRLHRARRLLLRGRKGEISVKHAALENGFWDLSHFTVHYRALFREMPSETVARSTRRSL